MPPAVTSLIDLVGVTLRDSAPSVPPSTSPGVSPRKLPAFTVPEVTVLDVTVPDIAIPAVTLPAATGTTSRW
ncbi:hypothetical protein [Streptomyces carpinensis]|uniref:Uncharacterized protein n=1 Tax=Streptomyces carpinensis TaxID=66369 RepID=A0ABV1W6Y3_9ACTN|nr:hypothetical protein [Streptomyces carpinensis]